MTDHQPEVSYIFAANVIRVVDGDTLELQVDRGFSDSSRMMVRLYGADCPECRGPERAAGEWVTRQVEAWLGNESAVVIESKKVKQSFSRYLFHVWRGNSNLATWLLDSRLAWPTDSDGRIIGQRDVMTLSLPEGIKQSVREAMS